MITSPSSSMESQCKTVLV